MTVTTVLGVGLVTSLTIGGLLYLIRRRRSRSWGLCTLPTRLEGRVVVVTGGNAGLGAELCLDLAKRGATVVLACRSWDNTKDTLARIRGESGNNDVHYMHLDLGNFCSIREFSSSLLAKYPEVHVLVCNAGVWVPMEQGRLTDEGHEVHTGTNHLGHFLLVSLLTDRLRESAPSRVVMVSSSLMNQAKLDLENTDHFGKGRQPEPGSRTFAPTGYCDSKMMNALFAQEFGRRLSGTGVTSVAVCPGWCYTQLARHVHIPFIKKIMFAPFAFMFMRSAWRGSQNILQAVLEESDKLEQGGFYRECKLATNEMKKLEGMADVSTQLWEVSEGLVGIK